MGLSGEFKKNPKPGCRQFFLNLAAYFYRGEARASSRHDFFAKVGFVVASILVFSCLFAAVQNEYALWRLAYPEMFVSRSDWRVNILNKPLLCAKNCPVDFSHEPFWRSSQSLANVHISAQLKEGTPKEVWLGLQVSPEKLKELREKQLSYFVLGWLKGGYSLWLNGILLQKISEDEYGPQVVALPVSFLDSKTGLSLIIRLEPRPGAKNLVPFTAGMKEGFGDYRVSQAFRSYHRFTGSSKPLSLFLVYFVLSSFFFLLWRASPKNTEYLYLSLFTLICSLPNILFSDGFSFRLSPAFSMGLYVIIIFMKAAAAMNLGLSFSRSRPSLALIFSASLLVAGFILIAVAPTTALSALRKPLNQYLVSFAYLLGGLGCFLQAVGLYLREKEGFSFQFRKWKLSQFAVILSCLAVIQFLQYGSFFNSLEIDILWDIPEVALALFLGFIAICDYRTQYEMVEKTPLSIYHKRPVLPESVAGVLMMLDLKNSENIFRSSLDGHSSLHMPAIIATIWGAIAGSGGVVIKAEGDEVIAFFDSEKHPNPLHSALCAADRCQQALAQIAAELDHCEGGSIAFRVGISHGRIRPIWVGQGSDRLPAWTQTEDSMVFVECARLMEAEKEIQKSRFGAYSLVVFAHALLQNYELDETRLSGSVTIRGQRIRGKHDRIYAVTCYSPGKKATKTEITAA